MTEVCRGRGVIHDDCEVGPKTKASREGQTGREREREIIASCSGSDTNSLQMCSVHNQSRHAV